VVVVDRLVLADQVDLMVQMVLVAQAVQADLMVPVERVAQVV